jgi:hypothetical protein
MNVVQAEALSKTVPGLKHVVLSRGLIDLSRDVPSSDVDLLASRNRLPPRHREICERFAWRTGERV